MFVHNMVQQGKQYMNSRLLGELYQEGDKSLVAVYAMLLHGRGGYHCYKPIKHANNKTSKGKRLLAKKSNVSLTALNTHLQKLVDKGLGHHMKNGGFFLVGADKIDERYGCKKKVPIVIGKNLRMTKGNVNALFVIASMYGQARAIDKKITLSKIQRQVEKGYSVSKSEYKMLARYCKKQQEDGNEGNPSKNKVENIVLSNKRIAQLVEGSKDDKGHSSVAKGGYWRKVLVDRGFISTRRRFKSLSSERYTYKQFLAQRNALREVYGHVTYKNGRIVTPLVSEVMFMGEDMGTNFYASKQMKRKAWWDKNAKKYRKPYTLNSSTIYTSISIGEYNMGGGAPGAAAHSLCHS